MPNILTSFGQGDDFGHRDYTEARKAGFSNDEILKWMDANPNKLEGLNAKGDGGLYDEILSSGRGRDAREASENKLGDFNQIDTSYGWRGNDNTFNPDAGYKINKAPEKEVIETPEVIQDEVEETPELINPLTEEGDTGFWDKVEDNTPPADERNAGDILEIIEAVKEIQDEETPSEFNVNSNSVTSDQTADWRTLINNSGKRAQINADVINDNYIVNRNEFNPDDPTGEAANNFNFNTSDATQDLQWETGITNTGDDAVINAGVYNSLGNFNDNRYGESFSQAGDQDSEDGFSYISSSNEFSPEDTEGNVTNDVSFIRDRNDIGTKFLDQFRSNLFA